MRFQLKKCLNSLTTIKIKKSQIRSVNDYRDRMWLTIRNKSIYDYLNLLFISKNSKFSKYPLVYLVVVKLIILYV